MIEVKNVTKKFDSFVALDNVDLTIDDGLIYGLLGTNGAGKSTLLRIITGVIKADEGQVLLDGENTYDNPSAKKKMFFIADDQHFFYNSTGEEMAKYYAAMYEDFDMDYFHKVIEMLSLDSQRKIGTFSKGMKKQLSIVLGICAKTDVLLCDETFDGLDPVMRQAIKSLIANELTKRKFIPVITSHNLRELEDICDVVGILHKGGVLLSKDLDSLKENIQKVQCVFEQEDTVEDIKKNCEIVNIEKRGRLYVIIVRGTRENVDQVFASVSTVFYELLPLSLEEIFISETEVVGYDVKKLFLEV